MGALPTGHPNRPSWHALLALLLALAACSPAGGTAGCTTWRQPKPSGACTPGDCCYREFTFPASGQPGVVLLATSQVAGSAMNGSQARTACQTFGESKSVAAWELAYSTDALDNTALSDNAMVEEAPGGGPNKPQIQYNET